MQIYHIANASKGFKPSISLDKHFAKEVIKSIKFATLGNMFRKWIIIEPKNSIKVFIAKYRSIFNQYQWKLTETKFENRERGIISTNVLFIHRA